MGSAIQDRPCDRKTVDIKGTPLGNLQVFCHQEVPTRRKRGDLVGEKDGHVSTNR
jgi:hypothetical protein